MGLPFGLDAAAALVRSPLSRPYEYFVVGPKPSVAASGTPGDPGWCRPGGPSWEVFGDPAATVAVFAAMLMQAGSPVIADAFNRFGTYDSRPEHRFWLTGGFYFATTFGSCEEAESWVQRTRHGHRGISGSDLEGRQVAAATPSVMRLSHLSVLTATLRAWELFGTRTWSEAEQDEFVAEQAWAAARIGIPDIPHCVAELRDAVFECADFPEVSSAGRESVDSILAGKGLPLAAKPLYAAILSGSRAALPFEHRQAWGLDAGLADVAVGRTFVEAARLAVGELSVAAAARARLAAGPAPEPTQAGFALTQPVLTSAREGLGALRKAQPSGVGEEWLRGSWGSHGPSWDRTVPLCAERPLRAAGLLEGTGRLTSAGAGASAVLAAETLGWNQVYRDAQRRNRSRDS